MTTVAWTSKTLAIVHQNGVLDFFGEDCDCLSSYELLFDSLYALTPILAAALESGSATSDRMYGVRNRKAANGCV